jgi:hypothetical protein
MSPRIDPCPRVEFALEMAPEIVLRAVIVEQHIVAVEQERHVVCRIHDHARCLAAAGALAARRSIGLEFAVPDGLPQRSSGPGMQVLDSNGNTWLGPGSDEITVDVSDWNIAAPSSRARRWFQL